MTTEFNSPPSERSAETRGRILDAALVEFSAHGLAGARTEQIAAAAGVNKALLYYYFTSKENLYIAALEMIAGKVRDSSMAVFLSDASAGERIVRSALNHFDRIMSQQDFQRLMQQEMMRLHTGESGALPILVERAFAPIYAMFQALTREGIASGELIEADWMQIMLTALGANVFYFLSAPIRRLLDAEEPLRYEALAQRRKALVDYLGQALFNDRQHGAAVAARVFADTPMPEMKGDRLNWEER